jgi:dGTP triphosphohydrolase
MKKLTQKNKEVLDICLSSESSEVKAKVYEILEISELDASDPMFLVLALTGQMRVLLEAAPLELSKLLNDWQEQSVSSLQSIQEAITQVKSTQQQQADTIRETLETVTNNCVEDIKQAGMATTSAIADANSETLAQASKTATAAAALTNATVALRDEVLADRQINQQVLQNILQQLLDAKTELNQAVDRTKGMYGAMDKLRTKLGFLLH